MASGESWGRLARASSGGAHGASRGSWLATRAAVRSDAREAQAPPVLRIVHTADVHLGARHADMGDQASAQRERQFAAFKTTVDLAIEERVDLFLIAGDLFDSNTQPRRSVERVAAELARLAGRLDDATAARHAAVLRSVGLPVRLADVAADDLAFEDLLATMRVDKKARGDMMRFIVLDGVGRASVLNGPEEALLFAAYQEIGS